MGSRIGVVGNKAGLGSLAVSSGWDSERAAGAGAWDTCDDRPNAFQVIASDENEPLSSYTHGRAIFACGANCEDRREAVDAYQTRHGAPPPISPMSGADAANESIKP